MPTQRTSLRHTFGIGLIATALVCAPFAVAPVAGAATVAEQAKQILQTAGVRGGLVVHLGCGDGTLTAALRASDAYLVHGLDRDAVAIAQARKRLLSRGLYGKVAVERLLGNRLPHTDNLVNLLVADDLDGVSMAEVMRVLAPRGVACLKKGDAWTTTVKPRPADVDEWPHFLHGPDGNAVSRDHQVGPPRHMQWVASPQWARSHEHMASISAAVSAGGRLFYIADEGPVASVTLPPLWRLVARDAFNGVLLWKLPVGPWAEPLRGFRSGPAEMPRRLVAVGDRVYVTLGYGKPLTAHDAATGRVVRTYEGTEGAHEIVHDDGVLYVAAGDIDAAKAKEAAKRRGPVPPVRHKRLLAIQADTGSLLWRLANDDTTELLPLTLAVAGGRLYYHSTKHLICLDARMGKERWRVERAVSLKRQAWSTPTLVVHKDVVLCADRPGPKGAAATGGTSDEVEWVVSIGGGGRPGQLTAYAADTGKKLWAAPCQESYNAPTDVFVVNDQVWTGKVTRARDPGFTTVRDVFTGEVKREFPVDKHFQGVGMPHHRCHRNKATDRFILASKAGIEFIDVQTGKVLLHNWVRGTCQYGILAGNGLIYAPSHSCACFIKGKLVGFNALAAARPSPPQPGQPAVERGPAYDAIGDRQSTVGNASDWPTYRHDAIRSGATATAVPAACEPLWEADLGGRLTSPVAAGGRAYVAAVDTHTVHALSAADGKVLWSYTTGGRVDSPPTVHGPRVLFGSADGWVYCLRASDGALAWRFRAAPEERRVVSYGQVESAWPVHGSVLVQEGGVLFAAGRSSFLDGGLRLYHVDAAKGRLLYEGRVYDLDPKTGRQPPAQGFEMNGALPDVLSSDGKSVYMRHLRFDTQWAEQPEDAAHLFSPTGLLDGSWWHRSYWIYGAKFTAGWGGWWRVGNTVPSGRLLVFDAATVYGYGRNRYPSGNAGQWSGETYRLFAAAKDAKPEPPPARKPPEKGAKKRRRPQPKRTIPLRWTAGLPIQARALVLAGDVLFAAGPKGDGTQSLAAYEGREGSLLLAVSTTDGKTTAQRPLAAPPVFDGMAAARGKLFLTTKDGKVLCFGAK